jgi:hypothetical protein
MENCAHAQPPDASSALEAGADASGSDVAEVAFAVKWNDVRSPDELCCEMSQSLQSLASAGLSGACEDLERDLRRATLILESAGRGEDHAEEAHKLLIASLAHGLPGLLLAHLASLGFEARKVATRFFAMVIQSGMQLNLRAEVIAYMRDNPQVTQDLLQGYGQEEMALHYGDMLRSCTSYPELVTLLLDNRAAFGLLDLVRHGSFDVSSDAIASMRELFLAHEEASARYLETHFDTFFDRYNGLLSAHDYVTQRQLLKLLGDMLLCPHFGTIMARYVTSVQNIKIIMKLLLNWSRQIQVGAFHIFKIFVAIPDKPPQIKQILCNNRDKLVRLLEGLQSLKEMEKDEGFNQDVRSVIHMLEAMAPPSDRLAAVPKAPPESLAAAVVH